MKIKLDKNGISMLTTLAALLFLYSSVILHCILVFTGKSSESGQLKWIYILSVVTAYIFFILTSDRMVQRKYVIGVGCLVVLLLLFQLTGLKYDEVNLVYNSERLLLIAVMLGTIIFPLLIKKLKIESFPPIQIIFLDIIPTLIILYVALSSKLVTSGGLLSSNSGLIYQNTSYYAAYMFGISIFILQEKKYGRTGYPHKVIIYLLMIIQTFVCVIAGGRGGFLLFAVLAVYMLLTISNNALRNFILLLTIIFIFYVIIRYVPSIAGKFGLNINGLNRILNVLNRTESVDTSREILWRKGLQGFYDKPIFGNGLGSVFFKLGTYSHNCFIDMLCETGIVGTSIFISILSVYFLKVRARFNSSSITRFFFMVFICGFIMNLFSGYLIVNNFVLLPVFYEIVANSGEHK